MNNFMDFLREYESEKFIPLICIVVFLVYRVFARQGRRLLGIFFIIFSVGGVYFFSGWFGAGWAVLAFLGWLLIEKINNPP